MNSVIGESEKSYRNEVEQTFISLTKGSRPKDIQNLISLMSVSVPAQHQMETTPPNPAIASMAMLKHLYGQVAMREEYGDSSKRGDEPS